MKIYVLFGQRKCDYPGQYAIEALQTIDEYAYFDSREWMDEQISTYQESSEFDSLALVPIELPKAAIVRALYPAEQTVEGKVVDSE